MASDTKSTYIDHRNWPDYNALLIGRGDLHPLIEIVKNWATLLEKDNEAKEGRPFNYPNELFDIYGKLW